MKNSNYSKPQHGVRTKQHFDYEKTQYFYNKVTGLLEELPEKVNIQVQINSMKGQSFEDTMERLHAFDKQTVAEGDIYDYPERVNDLSAAGEALDIIEEYRDMYNLPDNMDILDVYNYMQTHVKDGQKMQSKKEVDDNEISKAQVPPVQSTSESEKSQKAQ